jgi:2,4-dienoyl-CoA reductase-like NADH-dependent reductase (Old Yellow Enzyme family)/thioredoxin reductase
MNKRLLERGKIGNVELKNRIFKPAAECFHSNDGYVPEGLIRFHAEQARGGVGLVISGMFIVARHERPGQKGSAMIENDGRINGFSALAKAIQGNGAKACLQLAHWGSHDATLSRCVSLEGLQSIEFEEWLYILNPKFFDPRNKPPHQEYSIDEIKELVSDYGDGAVRAKKAGFDMVEVHGGHRHGLGCFLSPLTNRRTDMYGGSSENRARILYEIIEDIQAKVGKDFPIIVRLNGTDSHPKGQQIEDTVEISKKLERMGVAALNVSIQMTVQPMQLPPLYTLPLAEAVRKAVGIPVLTAGSISTYEQAEEALEQGKADFIGTGRALYADPKWPMKVKQGRPEDISPCIRCCECAGERIGLVGPLGCTVNVALNRNDLAISPAEYKKNVAVVGGGPAGIEAARVCTLRGHRVVIFEKRKIGGLLNEASVPPFKAEIKRLFPYYNNMIKKLNIEVKNEAATVKKLKGYDAVIVATGSTKVELHVPGADSPHVYFAIDVLGSNTALGKKVTIIGGGTVGVETALWLAAQGKDVTIVEMLDQIMRDEISLIKIIYDGMLKTHNVTILTSHKLDSIQKDSVMVTDKDGNKKQIAADNVIMSVGLKPEQTLLCQLEKETDIPVYAAGDCIKPRKIYDAIHEGYAIALEV